MRVQFQHGVVDIVKPEWQAPADAEAGARAAREAELAQIRPMYALGLGVLGLICLLGGPAGLFVLGTTLDATNRCRWWPIICPKPPMI